MTDSTRNGGEIFYARERFDAAPDAIDPTARHHTIRHYSFAKLSPEVRREYVELSALTLTEKQAWLNGFRLDAPGGSRFVFFAHRWPRFGDIYPNPNVVFELLADNIKAFAAESLRYLEMNMGVTELVAQDGTKISAKDAVAMLEARLALPDVVGTGLVVRFQEMVLRFTPDANEKLAQTYAWVDAHRDR